MLQTASSKGNSRAKVLLGFAHLTGLKRLNEILSTFYKNLDGAFEMKFKIFNDHIIKELIRQQLISR